MNSLTGSRGGLVDTMLLEGQVPPAHLGDVALGPGGDALRTNISLRDTVPGQ